jgi:putative membrane protein
MDGKSVVPAELSSKSGAEFDREFAKLMISDHQKDIAEFEKETRSGSDPDVKAWANRTLGTLRAHLQAAKALPELAMK